MIVHLTPMKSVLSAEVEFEFYFCVLEKGYIIENIGKVLDLNKKVVNGYTTLASVAIDENKKDVTLMEVMVYSNREDRFVKQKELEKFEKGKVEDEDRESKIKELVDKGV